METKSKSERIIFLGFVFLSISFIGLIIYFGKQNRILDERLKEIVNKEKEIELRNIALSETGKKTDLVLNEIKLMNPDLSEKIDTIATLANQSIKNNVTKIAIREGLSKSVIYVQVGSKASSLELKNKDFISKINAIGYNVINAYDLEEGRADNSIRYFNKQDKSLSEDLKNDIEKEFPNIILKPKFVPSNSKIPVGQVEVWIK